tara:strand:+ start:133 stop:378 length:246 start_codon:yes stop_codon:yes gene_type:complete
MKQSLRKRINVASCWATTRIAFLDKSERYEDSYAITQEFCEWITSLEEDTQYLQASVLEVPGIADITFLNEKEDTDEKLEI